MFPPRDPLLKELAEDTMAHPFEKHLAGESSPYELLKKGSWTSGDEAAQAGFDMRLFYKVRSYVRHFLLTSMSHDRTPSALCQASLSRA